MNVVLMMFNRPAETRRVFERIREARPEALFVVADGPRDEGEQPLCDESRAVLNGVDWPCRVHTRFSKENLGAGGSPAAGLSWVFAQVEEAIILEDDCLPDLSFFPYCQELLERYRDDTRVGHISGFNPLPTSGIEDSSYGFSIYPSCWGWAGWRRVWQHFDPSLKSFTQFQEFHSAYDLFPSRSEGKYFVPNWSRLHLDRRHVWDGQYFFAVRSQGMVAVRPRVNLITNIGFGRGVGATHTDYDHPVLSHVESHSMPFPLRHPRSMVVDREDDMRIVKLMYQLPNPVLALWKEHFGNRYWYGRQIRRLPWIGQAWAHARRRSARESNTGSNEANS